MLSSSVDYVLSRVGISTYFLLTCYLLVALLAEYFSITQSSVLVVIVIIIKKDSKSNGCGGRQKLSVRHCEMRTVRVQVELECVRLIDRVGNCVSQVLQAP